MCAKQRGDDAELLVRLKSASIRSTAAPAAQRGEDSREGADKGTKRTQRRREIDEIHKRGERRAAGGMDLLNLSSFLPVLPCAVFASSIERRELTHLLLRLLAARCGRLDASEPGMIAASSATGVRF